MASGSPGIGEARERAAAFAANSRTAASSLRVQPAQGDGFADVFRLIANASPPASRAPSRGDGPGIEVPKRQDDDSQKPEELSASSRDEPAPQKTVEDHPQTEPVVALKMLAKDPRPNIAGENTAAAKPATLIDEAEPQDSLVSEAGVPVAGQPHAAVSSDSPANGSLQPEATPEDVQVIRDPGIANGSETAGEPTTVHPEAVAASASPIAQGAVPQPSGADRTPAAKPTSQPISESVSVPLAESVSTPRSAPEVPLQPAADAQRDPALPQRSLEPVVEPNEGGAAAADALDGEGQGKTGKPIFAGQDEERSDSRRRREARDPQWSSSPPDANRVQLERSPAEMRARQAEMVSAETGGDTAAANQAVQEIGQLTETRQATSHSTPPPVVSAVAAANPISSDTPALKSSPQSTPPIGAPSSQTPAAEGGQRTTSHRSSGPGIADRIRLVQRVANAFQRLGVDGGQVRIRLHPADLGSVRLDLQIQGNRMNARVTTETEAARGILREHLPDLRQRLLEQGIQVERIEVELDTDSQGSRDTSHREEQSGRFDQPQRRDSRPAPLRSEREPSGSSAPLEVRQTRAGRTVAEAASRPGVDLSF